MMREYIVSESMHALNIPTTRSLAVVATGRQVQRETLLPGAVLTRVASSHLRVGSFQYARASNDMDLLRRLADHAIERHHPSSADEANRYLELLKGVISVQAKLVAQWMLVGFVHGVMNTDNMTVSGETIDYGPCAFMEGFDPGAVYSSIDEMGRYAYRSQPVVAEWNLARFAESIAALIHQDEEQAVHLAVEALNGFRQEYSATWFNGMRAKLGLPEEIDDDVASPLVDDLLQLVQEARADYTSFFRSLGKAARGGGRADASADPGPGRLRCMVGTLAGAQSGCRCHGQGQPDLYSTEPLGGGSPCCRNRGGHGPPHGAVAGGPIRPVQGTLRPGKVRRACAGKLRPPLPDVLRNLGNAAPKKSKGQATRTASLALDLLFACPSSRRPEPPCLRLQPNGVRCGLHPERTRPRIQRRSLLRGTLLP